MCSRRPASSPVAAHQSPADHEPCGPDQPGPDSHDDDCHAVYQCGDHQPDKQHEQVIQP